MPEHPKCFSLTLHIAPLVQLPIVWLSQCTISWLVPGVFVRGHLGYCLVSLVSSYLLRVLYSFMYCVPYCFLLLLSVSCSVMPSILF